MNIIFTTMRRQRGQGLLEAVIALGIIMSGLVAALTLAVGNLSAGTRSESRIIGANLAREGVEVVRNIRDSNWVRGDAWDTGLSNGEYVVRWDLFTHQQKLALLSSVLDDGRLYEQPGNGLMNVDTGGDISPGSATRFVRTVALSDICKEGLSPCERIGIRVAAHVAWYERGVEPVKPQVEVIADLYKWRSL